MYVLLTGCSRIYRNPRGPLTRSIGFQAIVVVCLCSIAYFTYFLPDSASRGNLQVVLPVSTHSSRLRGQGTFRWKNGPKRLVAFGNSWSDNGQYPIDPPPEDQVIARDTAQGRVWTDWLCAAVFKHVHLWPESMLTYICRSRVPITTILQGLL